MMDWTTKRLVTEKVYEGACKLGGRDDLYVTGPDCMTVESTLIAHYLEKGFTAKGQKYVGYTTLVDSEGKEGLMYIQVKENR